MTTHTVLLDLYDYGASELTVTRNNPDTLASAVAAESVTQSNVNGCRYAAVFEDVTAGVAAICIEVNGIPGLLYCTFTGVDGETVSARAERGAVLSPATETKIDQTLAAVQTIGSDLGVAY